MRVQPLMLLSQVRHGEERFTEELALLDEVVRRVDQGRMSPIEELAFRRAEALLRLGRRLEAEEAYRAETSSFPFHRRAWLSLALVVGAQGRAEEARSLLGAALEANPNEAMARGVREAFEIMGDTDGLRQLGLD